jgi:tetratricopeptide (TPR) repeat protein
LPLRFPFRIFAGACLALAPAQSFAGQTVPEDAALAQARSLTASGNLPEAEQQVRTYLKEHPASADAHYLLAYILYREAKAKDSLAEYTEAAKYRRPTALDLQGVGADYVILDDFPDADKWFSLSVEWDPKSLTGWYYLGRTKYNENRFEEAIHAFEKCLELDPKNVKAKDNLGLALQGLERLDDAQKAFETAIEWQKGSLQKNPEPYIDLGALWLERNEAGKAVPYLQSGLEINPKSARAHQQLGKAHFVLKEYGKAQSELEEAIRLAPDNAPAHYVLAQVYRKQGLSEQANGEFAKYKELSGTHSTRETLDSYPASAPR